MRRARRNFGGSGGTDCVITLKLSDSLVVTGTSTSITWAELGGDIDVSLS